MRELGVVFEGEIGGVRQIGRVRVVAPVAIRDGSVVSDSFEVGVLKSLLGAEAFGGVELQQAVQQINRQRVRSSVHRMKVFRQAPFRASWFSFFKQGVNIGLRSTARVGADAHDLIRVGSADHVKDDVQLLLFVITFIQWRQKCA